MMTRKKIMLRLDIASRRLLGELCIGVDCLEYIIHHIEPPFVPPPRPARNVSKYTVSLDITRLSQICREFTTYSQCVRAIIFTAYIKNIRQPARDMYIPIVLPKYVWKIFDSMCDKTPKIQHIRTLINSAKIIRPLLVREHIKDGIRRVIKFRAEDIEKLREKCINKNRETWVAACVKGLIVDSIYASLSSSAKKRYRYSTLLHHNKVSRSTIETYNIVYEI